MDKEALLLIYKYAQTAQKLLALVVILPLVITFACLPCLSSIYQLKDEIDNYNRDDFQNVIFIGRIIENEIGGADNEIARYYLANAYARLNRTQEAIQEYRVCWIDGKDPRIRAYADQALKSLQPSTLPQSALQSNFQLSTSDTSNVHFVRTGSSRYVKNYVNYDGDLPPPPEVKGLKATEKILKLSLPYHNNQKRP